MDVPLVAPAVAANPTAPYTMIPGAEPTTPPPSGSGSSGGSTRPGGASGPSGGSRLDGDHRHDDDRQRPDADDGPA